MKLIIDIPEEEYKFIKDLQFYYSGRRSGKTIENHIINAIKTGMPYEETPHDIPHGKWVKIFENPFTNGYVCPFCGHKIQVTEQFLPKVTKCEACGAVMRGAENET